jgi:hypothetical protein
MKAFLHKLMFFNDASRDPSIVIELSSLGRTVMGVTLSQQE